MNPQQTAELAAALLRGEWPDARPADLAEAVRGIADRLLPQETTLGAEALALACHRLNKQRQHDHACLLGQAWQDRHGFDATLRRHWAQALVNLGAVDRAEALVLEGLALARAVDASAQAESEIPEFEGLLGRIYKQRFVATGNRDQLLKATNQYLAQYQSLPGRPYWHGINAVALRAREERLGMGARGRPSSVDLATGLVQQVLQLHQKNPRDHWPLSTLSEAYLALGDCDSAELWLYRFLGHPNTGPFDLDSYNRQLQEIWEGRPVGPGATCADRLAAIVAQRMEQQQSRLTVSAPQVQALRADEPGLEKNFSGETGFSIEDIRSLLSSCSSIGCVTNRSGVRLGTGFLLEGAALEPSLGPGLVLMTNAHVVPDAVAVDAARVTFELESEASEQPISYAIGELLFTSPVEVLDVSVLRLKGLSERLTALSIANALPLIDPKSRAYVVGHPQGGGLQISLHDSQLLDVDDDERLIHYRTPTDPGSSGSPVFNGRWQVIALHHSGSAKTKKLHGEGTYEANEGIVLGAIQRALAARAAASG